MGDYGLKCRLCLNNLSTSEAIECRHVEKLYKMLDELFSIVIEEAAVYSTKICHTCYTKCVDHKNFKNMVDTNQVSIREHIRLNETIHATRNAVAVKTEFNNEEVVTALTIETRRRHSHCIEVENIGQAFPQPQPVMNSNSIIIYECFMCTAPFSSKDTCSAHIRKHISKGDKPLKCKFCLKYVNRPKKHKLECQPLLEANRRLSVTRSESTSSEKAVSQQVMAIEKELEEMDGTRGDHENPLIPMENPPPTNVIESSMGTADHSDPETEPEVINPSRTPRRNSSYFEVLPWETEINAAMIAPKRAAKRPRAKSQYDSSFNEVRVSPPKQPCQTQMCEAQAIVKKPRGRPRSKSTNTRVERLVPPEGSCIEIYQSPKKKKSKTPQHIPSFNHRLPLEFRVRTKPKSPLKIQTNDNSPSKTLTESYKSAPKSPGIKLKFVKSSKSSTYTSNIVEDTSPMPSTIKRIAHSPSTPQTPLASKSPVYCFSSLTSSSPRCGNVSANQRRRSIVSSPDRTSISNVDAILKKMELLQGSPIQIQSRANGNKALRSDMTGSNESSESVSSRDDGSKTPGPEIQKIDKSFEKSQSKAPHRESIKTNGRSDNKTPRPQNSKADEISRKLSSAEGERTPRREPTKTNESTEKLHNKADGSKTPRPEYSKTDHSNQSSSKVDGGKTIGSSAQSTSSSDRLGGKTSRHVIEASKPTESNPRKNELHSILEKQPLPSLQNKAEPQTLFHSPKQKRQPMYPPSPKTPQRRQNFYRHNNEQSPRFYSNRRDSYSQSPQRNFNQHPNFNNSRNEYVGTQEFQGHYQQQDSRGNNYNQRSYNGQQEFNNYNNNCNNNNNYNNNNDYNSNFNHNRHF